MRCHSSLPAHREKPPHGTAKRWPSTCQKTAFAINQVCQHLDLRFLAPRTKKITPVSASQAVVFCHGSLSRRRPLLTSARCTDKPGWGKSVEKTRRGSATTRARGLPWSGHTSGDPMSSETPRAACDTRLRFTLACMKPGSVQPHACSHCPWSETSPCSSQARPYLPPLASVQAAGPPPPGLG